TSAGLYFWNGDNAHGRGPGAVADFGQAGADEALDRIAGLAQHPPVGGEARCLDGEDETVRHRRGPFPEALRFLRTVIGRVDLDRGQMLARISQFLGLRQALRIEDAAPGREIPAADADMNSAGLDLSCGFSSDLARFDLIRFDFVRFDLTRFDLARLLCHPIVIPLSCK